MSLRPRAHIHLSNIADNWRTLQAAQNGGVTGAVVKADAYGHGLPQVAEALHDAGCDHFFVAHSYEAEITRARLGSHPNIYVLNGPSPDEEALYRENALIPVINSSFQFRTMRGFRLRSRGDQCSLAYVTFNIASGKEFRHAHGRIIIPNLDGIDNDID